MTPSSPRARQPRSQRSRFKVREIASKVASLRGRSLDELATRTTQMLSAAAERVGLSPDLRIPDDARWMRSALSPEVRGVFPDARGLLTAFRNRTPPSFFAAFHDPEATRSLLRARWPAEEAIRRADRVRRKRFELFGHPDLSFGDPIDWHRDPLANRRAPLVHWSRVPFLDVEAAGDHKVIWELNRHQHFLLLGRACWHTGDERYAAAFAEHVTAWMDANPPKRGINWASSLELAFRSIAWLWALHFFRDSPHLTPELFLRMLKFLRLQGRHVERHLSTYFSPNTHLTGEALGLFYLGTIFPELREAAVWREKGRRILLEQLPIHVRPDGVYFEQTTYYHRYTADFYLHLLLLAQAGGRDVREAVTPHLRALLDHLMCLTRPDGTTPLIGDDDGGRFVPLDGRAPSDFRTTLAVGAAVFDRSDYRFVADEPTEELLWLLGPDGVRRYDALESCGPPRTSVAFPHGGYFTMRDGWTPDANHLVVDCGPHGADNCGHAHADALAIEVAAGGTTALIDPGTYTYTAEPEQRDRFRLSLAHNTVAVDGQSSSVPSGPFQWKHIAGCFLREWISTERFDFFEGEHDGYARLTDPAIHARSVLFIKGEYWIVRDEIRAAGEHRIEASFHFPAGTKVEVTETRVPGVRLAQASGAPVLGIAVAGAEQVGVSETLVSPSYGRLARAPSCRFGRGGTGTQELVSFLVPATATKPAAVVEAEEAAGGQLLVRRGNTLEDWIAISSGPGGVRSPTLETDACWVWLRCTRGGRKTTVRELILLSGTLLRVNGVELVHADEPVQYLSVRWMDDEVRLDLNARTPVTLDTCDARTVYNGERAYPVNTSGRCTIPPAISGGDQNTEIDEPLFAGSR